MNFEYGEEINVHGGCGAVLMGQMIYFGGGNDKRQVWSLINKKNFEIAKKIGVVIKS